MKRLLSIVTAAVLVGSVFVGPLPAHAQAVPAVPAEPNVTDPINDANYLNDQGLNSITGRDGDHEGPADASTSADIVAGWFTNDAASVTAHILVEGGLPSTPSYFYRMLVDPAGGEDDCLWFQAGIPGIADAGSPDPTGDLRNLCGDGSSIEGEVALAENPEGGTIISIKIPMGTHGLAIGMTLGAPNATSRNWLRTPARSATAPQVDNTKPGIPYTITAGDSVEEEPDEEEEPEKPKKAKKNKSKKKKKKGKPKPPAACPAYVPGEEGAEAETTIVTDAATEEEPVVVELDTAMGLGNDAGLGEFATGSPIYDETTRVFQNVQVDIAAGDTGIYARLDFAEFRDYDLYLNYPNGDEADHSGDFNPIANTVFSCGGTSCESSSSHEAILGIRTPDCGGWTVEMVSYLSEGGPVTLSLWLGEALADPAPPAEDDGVLGLFYSLMGV